MIKTSLRFTVAGCLALGASIAFGETYTAEIYSRPGTYTQMYILGHGDSAMMSGYVSGGGSDEKAAYRTNTGYKVLHPAGTLRSYILDSWGGTYHCGFADTQDEDGAHAYYWVGGGTGVDLHPAGNEYRESKLTGGGGQLQVGYVEGSFTCVECGNLQVGFHAGVWSRTAASFQRLHSTTHYGVTATGTDGTKIVGNGNNHSDGSYNALMWNSATGNTINLRPSMSTYSYVQAIWGNQQGGNFRGPSTSNNNHAVLWTNTPASAVDLNPNTVFVSSEVHFVRDGLQVGVAKPIGNPTRNQAIAWHGSALSWINLHSRLPAPFNTWHSYAEGIDQLGNVTGYISNPAAADVRPVVWRRG
jgi:hypothetical protein